MTGAPMLFADFVPGTELGVATATASAEQLAEWAELYPWDQPEPGTIPTGMATVLLMRGFHQAIPHRPPGNIHVRQTMQALNPIRIGEAVTTRVSCLSAEQKGERRKLELAVNGTGVAERPLFAGIITLYWSA